MGYRLLGIWLIRMKLRHNVGKLLNNGDNILDMLKVSDGDEILLIRVPCVMNTVVCLHLKLKKDELFIIAIYFPHFCVPNP
jgi:hypothetical protein